MDDDAAGMALADLFRERHVDLEHVGMECGEQGQAGEPGAEVVDGDAQTQVAVLSERRLEPPRIFEALFLRDLDDEPLERQTGALCSCDGRGEAGYVVGRCTYVDVDAQIGTGAQQAEGAGDVDGGKPAGAIDTDAIGHALSCQYGRRGFVAVSANERLIGDDASGFKIDDGLEGHGKRPGGVLSRTGCKTWMEKRGAGGKA